MDLCAVPVRVVATRRAARTVVESVDSRPAGFVALRQQREGRDAERERRTGPDLG